MNKKDENFPNIYIRIQRKVCDSIQHYPREDSNLREMYFFVQFLDTIANDHNLTQKSD